MLIISFIIIVSNYFKIIEWNTYSFCVGIIDATLNIQSTMKIESWYVKYNQFHKFNVLKKLSIWYFYFWHLSFQHLILQTEVLTWYYESYFSYTFHFLKLFWWSWLGRQVDNKWLLLLFEVNAPPLNVIFVPSFEIVNFL